MARTTVRAPMPASRRAKQFAPFDALKGLKEAIARTEKKPIQRIQLAEDAIQELNAKLSALKKGIIITVVYYCEFEQAYMQITGPVMKVDTYWQLLQIGNVSIDFYEITEIECISALSDLTDEI